ncbi:hypothetical protein [Christiangramia crocea]|uniref:Uncharacterized protein n=1 Tax=Christiangramia crocea TaxID=2904124 RepID=A0A9X2A583_9FLAO|nr:hypothetical protein [Gramella crocea]MCG9971010.1 hypothetical protein [Gramella crocea]
MKSIEDAKKYLLSIGFDDAHLPELFNDDDKSYYSIPELMEEYAKQAVNASLEEKRSEIETNITKKWNEYQRGASLYEQGVCDGLDFAEQITNNSLKR